MIYDSSFLLALDAYPHKTTHVRLIAIDYWDKPVEAIEGRVTGGAISVSGDSAIQRTCNLTVIASEGSQITDVNWAFKNKFKVEIGLENHIDSKYPDIIWFKQGVFIVKSFSKAIQQNGSISVSISGMDKMCMLNGSIGGTLTQDVNFGDLDTISDSGVITTTKVPIVEIIQKALQQFGNERIDNIIINDLPTYGYELWTYRGDEPLYLIAEINDKNQYEGIMNMTLDQDALLTNTKTKEEIQMKDINKYYSTNTLDPHYNDDATIMDYYYNIKSAVIQVKYGETAGYFPTRLVYAGDLIENAGSTITSMLDKITNMLGAYEYFYNVEGQFVFQKKKNYVQEIFSPANGELYMPSAMTSQYSYQFKDKNLMTGLSYSPVIDKVKNDFAVWGTTKGASGAELPIHARCAIDRKPTQYTSLDDKQTTYIAAEYYKDIGPVIYCDWRELIYQMARDFLQYNTHPDFIQKLTLANPELVYNGKTGYEQYYTDIDGFWRQLYNPKPEAEDIENYYSQNDSHLSYRCWNKAIHTDPNSLKFWFEILDPGDASLSMYAAYNIGSRAKVNNSSTVKSIYYKETPEALFLVPPMTPSDYDMLAYDPIWIPYDMKALFTLSTQGISAIEQINTEINDNVCLGEGVSFQTIPIYYLLPNTRIEVLGEDYLLTSISLSFGTNVTMSLSGSKILKTII